MIKPAEILMGRDTEYPLSITDHVRLCRLLAAVNYLRGVYGKPLYVSSGYRPGHYNKSAGGASKSCHLTLEAVDFSDIDGEFKKWCSENEKELVRAGLYMEHPDHTPTWCHLQIRPTKQRYFIP